MPGKRSTYYLILLVFSQFAGTSLWFAGNAITDQLAGGSHPAGITSSVQLGFISGTLLFSIFTVADRFSAKTVFFISSLLAALVNAGILFFSEDAFTIKVMRFFTGFFLAGIYPVGMKIAADVFPEKLGKALGLLVGALVLGTSFPHFVRSQLSGLRWEAVIIATSALALLGGILVFLLFPGKKNTGVLNKTDFGAAFTVFKKAPFRAAAFGYFGHMWELYAFWSVLPLLFGYYHLHFSLNENPYWWSFWVIAAGSLGCAAGGLLSQRWGSRQVAFTALLFSGACCLLSPYFFRLNPSFFYAFLLFWGFVVTADSPQFSALVAKEAGEKNRGTALTIVTSIGFAITVISILLLNEIFARQKEYAFWLLAPGPLLGLWALKKIK